MISFKAITFYFSQNVSLHAHYDYLHEIITSCQSHCLIHILNQLIHILLITWCSGYHYGKVWFNWAWIQVLRRFKSCSRRVGDSRWWGSLALVPAANKAKRLSSVNHTTNTIHHHHHHIITDDLGVSKKPDFCSRYTVLLAAILLCLFSLLRLYIRHDTTQDGIFSYLSGNLSTAYIIKRTRTPT